MYIKKLKAVDELLEKLRQKLIVKYPVDTKQTYKEIDVLLDQRLELSKKVTKKL